MEGEPDVVLGPCEDGGYYLIGLKQPAPRLLREVRMSTDRVFADTLALAAEEGLQVEVLPEWYDVDDVISGVSKYMEQRVYYLVSLHDFRVRLGRLQLAVGTENAEDLLSSGQIADMHQESGK